MNPDERKAWTDTLKPGHKVAVNSGSYGYSRHSVGTVKRVTPTQLVVRDEHRREVRFRKDFGREMGGGTGNSRPSTIEALTQEIRDAIETAALAQWLGSLNQNNRVKLTLPVLRAMKAAHDKAIAAPRQSTEDHQ